MSSREDSSRCSVITYDDTFGMALLKSYCGPITGYQMNISTVEKGKTRWIFTGLELELVNALVASTPGNYEILSHEGNTSLRGREGNVIFLSA